MTGCLWEKKFNTFSLHPTLPAGEDMQQVQALLFRIWPVYQQEHYWEFVRNAESCPASDLLNLHFNNVHEGFIYTLQFEKHWSRAFLLIFPPGHLGKFLKMQMSWAPPLQILGHWDRVPGIIYFLKFPALWCIARCDLNYGVGADLP